jgi:hypothetical protein
MGKASDTVAIAQAGREGWFELSRLRPGGFWLSVEQLGFQSTQTFPASKSTEEPPTFRVSFERLGPTAVQWSYGVRECPAEGVSRGSKAFRKHPLTGRSMKPIGDEASFLSVSL